MAFLKLEYKYLKTVSALIGLEDKDTYQKEKLKPWLGILICCGMGVEEYSFWRYGVSSSAQRVNNT
jgi:hypothetical protein